jgi:hypothetical protein
MLPFELDIFTYYSQQIPKHIRILLSTTLFNTLQRRICCGKAVYTAFSHYLSFYYIFHKYECHQMIYLTTENVIGVYAVRATTLQVFKATGGQVRYQAVLPPRTSERQMTKPYEGV